MKREDQVLAQSPARAPHAWESHWLKARATHLPCHVKLLSLREDLGSEFLVTICGDFQAVGLRSTSH